MTTPSSDPSEPHALREPLALFSSTCPELSGTLGGVPAAGLPWLLASLHEQTGQPLLCVTGSAAQAERLVDDLVSILGPQSPRLFPESEMSMFDQGESDPARLRVLHELLQSRELLVVTSLLALLQPVPAPRRLRRRVLRVRDELDREKLCETLRSWEYRPADLVHEPGDLALRASVLDVYPSNGAPLRIELSEGRISGLRLFDALSQRTYQSLERVEILPMVEPEGAEALLDYFETPRPVVLCEPEGLRSRLKEMAAAAGAGWKFSAYHEVEILGDDQPDDWKQLRDMLACRTTLQLQERRAKPRVSVLSEASFHSLKASALPRFEGLSEFAEWARKRRQKLFVVTQHPARLRRILQRRGVSKSLVIEGALSQGLALSGQFYLVTDRELFGTTHRPRHQVRTLESNPEQEFSEGELVVHAERGIGRFLGLVTVELEGGQRDLLKLEYANDHSLLVPPEQIDKLSPYHASDGASEPALSRLDTEAWQKTLTRTRASVLATVQELQRQQAARRQRKACPMAANSPEQEELEAGFPYDETPSQLAAIEQIQHDLEQPVAMDRLLCGDVGYGKTEVALRAAFKVVCSGYQVALLAPTTVLAKQHFESFRRRMEPLGVAPRGLWGDSEDASETVAGLADGSVSMVVGTHSLLSDGVSFQRLGLLIVDEEQSFGVSHKQRLQELSSGVHVLSMSATPIPRTMQLALAGVRDISLLDAPPEARRPIRTYLLVEQPKLLAAALMRELERGGQAFVLHNRVEELDELASSLAKLVPGARLAVAHGQLDKGELEAVLAAFEAGESDVLVCSTIIEAGIDFPNVNTIVIKDAHRFGLAQLYQIRGRVGRSGRQAYCYLMVPSAHELNEKARLRLQTINAMTGLGSGFQIALRDLQIRGAGDLLGGDQSGEIARVGYTLYSQLLEQALGDQEGGQSSASSVAIDAPIEAYFPADYAPPIAVRIALYRQLALLSEPEQVEEFEALLQDRFGAPPGPVLRLLDLSRLRLWANRHRFSAITVQEQFGERSVHCSGPDGDPLILPRAPKGERLLPFVLQALTSHQGPERGSKR